ncbi:exodeoxyribonuclease V subunit alpha [Aquabacterium sp.]|uniref:exodeoxyribonuclease V subunit alpha n=1 Tax=Aquabacterium sp. TaxID=1872578 RepID=UPI0035B06F6E
MRPHEMMHTLDQWAEAGWLRRLDVALARFVMELDDQVTPTVCLTVAVLAQMEGRGHTCLPLAELVSAPEDLLAWPQAGQEAWRACWPGLPRRVADWLAPLKASRVVRAVERGDADEGQPLVLAGSDTAPRLYLRRYWLHECAVARQIDLRSQSAGEVDEGAVRNWLDKLFPEVADAGAQPHARVDWQKLACAVALRGRLSVITGGPGTGKTYTAARLLALLYAVDPAREQLRVALAAPTGKAAARLKQSIDASLEDLGQRLGEQLDLSGFTQRMGAARTLHALLGARPDTRALRFHAANPLDVDVLIVDEASMIHLEMMAALLDALPPTARLILLGDKDQLASVEAGAVLGDLCRDAEAGCYSTETARYALSVAGQVLPPDYLVSEGDASMLAQQTVMLRESRRFGGPIGQLALAVNRGDTLRALQCLREDRSGALRALTSATPADVLLLAVRGREGAAASYAAYAGTLTNRPPPGDADAHESWVAAVLKAFDRFRLLCAVRDGDWGTTGLNLRVEKALSEAGLLQPKGEWYVGRPIMITRNDANLGVFNGDIGVVLPSPVAGAGLRAYFMDGPVVRSVGVSRLAHVETAFAMTVHKSQGSEFEHTVLVLPPHGASVLNRELVYTGITRARQAFTLVAPQSGLLEAAVQQPTRRASGLLSLLAS